MSGKTLVSPLIRNGSLKKRFFLIFMTLRMMAGVGNWQQIHLDALIIGRVENPRAAHDDSTMHIRVDHVQIVTHKTT